MFIKITQALKKSRVIKDMNNCLKIGQFVLSSKFSDDLKSAISNLVAICHFFKGGVKLDKFSLYGNLVKKQGESSVCQ